MAKLDQNIITKDLNSLHYLNNFLNFVWYRYEKPDEMFTIAPFPAICVCVCVCKIDFIQTSPLFPALQQTFSGNLFEYTRNNNHLQVIKLTKFIENGRSCYARMLRPCALSQRIAYREAYDNY